MNLITDFRERVMFDVHVRPMLYQNSVHTAYYGDDAQYAYDNGLNLIGEK